MTSSVVFAYHNVGYRCLAVLLAQDVEIKLVVTHQDDANENVWFGSVAQLAALHDIPTITPEDPNTAEVIEQIIASAPDFIFSFYYRKMLSAPLLAAAKRGAFNMHGSLLPRYRGRVPVNWAIIHGEHETGATLHEMVVKPDAGRIVDQMAVPILPDDNAREVFDKVLVAAEIVLHRSLPALLAGTAAMHKQDLSAGSYFSGRRAEDGRIDWRLGAHAIHNLVRAVTLPYPGAFFELDGARIVLWRTLVGPASEPAVAQLPAIDASGARILVRCSDGHPLQWLDWQLDGEPGSSALFRARFGAAPVLLPTLLPIATE